MSSVSGHDLLSWFFMVDFQYLLMRLLEAIPPSLWWLSCHVWTTPSQILKPTSIARISGAMSVTVPEGCEAGTLQRGPTYPPKGTHNNSRGLRSKFLEFQDVWGLFSNPWTVVVRCFEPPLVNDQPLSMMHLIWSPCCLDRRCLLWKKDRWTCFVIL